MPLGTDVPASDGASDSTPADSYQREYEAMREWERPHKQCNRVYPISRRDFYFGETAWES